MSPSSGVPPRNPIFPPHRSTPLTLQRLAQPKSLHQRTGVEGAISPEHSHQRRVEKSILLFQRFKSFETGVDAGGGSGGGRRGSRGPKILRGDVWESFAEGRGRLVLVAELERLWRHRFASWQWELFRA
jgi:hypothetical protein